MADKPEIRHLKPKPDQRVIEHLEEILELAKRGEIRCVASQAIRSTGEVLSGWAGDMAASEIVYALEVWKFQIIRESDQGEIDLKR